MTTSSDIEKLREIVFHATPPAQTERALACLATLPGLQVTQTASHILQIRYCVEDHTLEGLESLLSELGFHLEATLLIRMKRALVYYVERVQQENLYKPEPRTKNYKAHVEAWKRRPHGDHDDTPSEWRQYK